MAEFIEREKVKEMLIYNWDECCSAVIGDLESIPAADVVERKTGKWIEIRMNSINPLAGRSSVYVGCSECHAAIPSDSQLDFIGESDCKFCYNCGAKMEG